MHEKHQAGGFGEWETAGFLHSYPPSRVLLSSADPADKDFELQRTEKVYMLLMEYIYQAIFAENFV